MSKFLALSLVAVALNAQTADIRVTASTIGTKVAAAMFGPLPKEIVAAQVLVCNNSASAVTVPLARIGQQLRPSGYTVLAPDIALAVIAASQGHSGTATALRWGVAAVQLAAGVASWSGLSAGIKNTLEASAIAGGQSLGIISTAVPTHTYLTLQAESLPDPLQISGGMCAKPGVVLAEFNAGTKTVDLSITVPR